MAENIFNISLLIFIYIYVGYPLFCLIWGGFFRRGVHSAEIRPRVSILISAYDEAACIVGTLRNKLDLDYPEDLVEIIVVSDASQDGTDDLVREVAATVADGKIRLLRQEPRAGKTAALNQAVSVASGEILVFSDANSLYAPDALRHLVAPFADPEVGYVTGRMVYKSADGSLTGDGCSAYMKYENMLRNLESAFGSVVGVDGGIDAVRAANYQQMRPDQQPDFILPLSVVEQGLRVVFAPEARVYEDAHSDAQSEFRMRVRVSLRAWDSLKEKVGLLDIMRYGVFSWQLFSHKWLRYLAPVFQVLVLLSNLSLAGDGAWWAVLALAQIGFYALAVYGHYTRGRDLPALLVFPYYLCLLNGAAAVALIKFLAGRKQVLWAPRN